MPEPKVTTSTVVISENLEINLDWLYDKLHISKVIQHLVDMQLSHNAFKTNVALVNPPNGTITMVKLRDQLKGYYKKQKRDPKKQPFRNSLSVVMYVGKLITIKIPKKGKIHMIGCLSEDNAKDCIKCLWNMIREAGEPAGIPSNPSTYIICGDTFKTYFHTVMTDIVFQFDFGIHRQKLDAYINSCTDFHSLEASFGYTGVNIKKGYSIVFEEETINTLECIDKDTWVEGVVSFNEWMNTLCAKEKRKHLSKHYKNTFLVFHSGRVIMSGKVLKHMMQMYDQFVDIIVGAQHEIKERYFDQKYKKIQL